MSFLKKLFGKQPGGSIFGNLIRGVANKATGGILGNGANRIEIGQTKTNKELGDEAMRAAAASLAPKETTFAGEPATKSADGTYNMTTPLNEVAITAQSLKKEPPIPIWMEKLGDSLSYLGKRTTDQTAVGMDNKTLFVIGGGILLLVGVLAMNKK